MNSKCPPMTSQTQPRRCSDLILFRIITAARNAKAEGSSSRRRKNPGVVTFNFIAERASFVLVKNSLLGDELRRRRLLRMDLLDGGGRDQSPSNTERQCSRWRSTPPTGIRTPRAATAAVERHLEKPVVVDGGRNGSASVGGGESSGEERGSEG